MGALHHKPRSPLVPRGSWYGPVFTVAILGVLAAYMTVERFSAVNPATTSAPANATAAESIAWTKYTELPSIPTGLQEPEALAVGPDGVVYIGGDRKVRIFRNGSPELEYVVPGRPHCLAVAAGGTVYVGFRDYVGVYDPRGRLLTNFVSLGLRAFLTALVTDGSSVWAADAGDRVVLHYDLHGKVLGRLGAASADQPDQQLVVPSPYLGLALGAAGLLVANPGRHQVDLYGTDGAWKKAWGKAAESVDGFCGCCNPTHLALLPDGRVVTAEKGRPRVKVYFPDGHLESVVAGEQYFRPETVGLALATDAQGRIYVLDPSRRAVRVFARK